MLEPCGHNTTGGEGGQQNSDDKRIRKENAEGCWRETIA
jgi:hypothetical protein